MPSNRAKMAAALRHFEEKADLRRRLEQMTSLTQPQNADAVDVVADVGAGFVPGIAQAQAVRDFERARREGDTVGMGLSTLAGVPVIGGVAKAANVARKADAVRPSLARWSAARVIVAVRRTVSMPSTAHGRSTIPPTPTRATCGGKMTPYNESGPVSPRLLTVMRRGPPGR